MKTSYIKGKVVEGGTEYIDACNKKERLMDILRELEKKSYKEFNTNGISKKDCIEMCLKHDENVKKKKPHPLTDDQIKLNELNKENQKELAINKSKGLNNENENTQ